MRGPERPQKAPCSVSGRLPPDTDAALPPISPERFPQINYDARKGGNCYAGPVCGASVDLKYGLGGRNT